MSAGAASARNRSPFTPTQWQELEQQALVFKYMVTGTPIPPDLIFSIKRSLDTSVTPRLFPHHPSKSFLFLILTIFSKLMIISFFIYKKHTLHAVVVFAAVVF